MHRHGEGANAKGVELRTDRKTWRRGPTRDDIDQADVVDGHRDRGGIRGGAFEEHFVQVLSHLFQRETRAGAHAEETNPGGNNFAIRVEPDHIHAPLFGFGVERVVVGEVRPVRGGRNRNAEAIHKSLDPSDVVGREGAGVVAAVSLAGPIHFEGSKLGVGAECVAGGASVKSGGGGR